MTEKMSKYDALYDKYSSSPSPKKGTKYERLVAFVTKALQTDSVVIHDIKLVGDSAVKHQIDISVSENDKPRKVLIECKDFDVAKRPVGLGIIRDFRSVVEDTKPDQAVVITCNRFTKDAKKFAKSKGIKLAVLRQFEKSDWDGRVRASKLRFHIMTISDPVPTIFISDQAAQEKLQEDLTTIGAIGGIWRNQPVYVHTDESRTQITEFIEEKANGYPREEEGLVRLEIPDLAIEVGDRGPIQLDAMVVEFHVFHDDDFYEITSNKVAELIFCPIEGYDIIIFDEDLKRCQLNEESGEVELSI